uniref:HepT-like ribonuclease domain-containing protein n=1 Tax=Algoriphagus sp. TaxID=1872435 RepID=UPI004047189F
MSKRSSDLLLLDMKEAAEKILKYTKGLSFEDFLADDKTIDAVVRNFEIIVEASLRIDEDFRFEHPQIEWKKLRGFRNRIVHDYFGD